MIRDRIYYRYSGKVGTGGLLYPLLGGAIGASVLGLIYGFIVPFLGFNKFAFAILILVGGLIGRILNWSGTMGKVRNPGLMIALGVLCGLVADYFGWIGWIYFHSNFSLVIIDPTEVMGYLQQVLREGTWRSYSHIPRDQSIIVFWVFEAIFFVGFTSFFAWKFFVKRPFCEQCNRWVDAPQVLAHREPLDDWETLRAHLEKGNIDFLKKLPKVKPKTGHYFKISLFQCSSCRQSNYLSVENALRRTSIIFRSKESLVAIVNKLIIDRAAYQNLLDE